SLLSRTPRPPCSALFPYTTLFRSTVRRKRLSRRLRELREERGLTSEEVTKRAGFSRGKLTRMERDEWTRPNPADIEKLQTIYKVARKSTRLKSSHVKISYAVFCLK